MRILITGNGLLGSALYRIKDNYKLCLHLDTDEGNAAGINKIGSGQII